MLIRILGGTMLMIAALWGGRQASASIRAGAKLFRSFLNALELLRADIAAFVPLSESLRHASSAHGSAARFFEAAALRMETENRVFSEIWTEELTRLQLPAEAFESLCSLGIQLGKYDVQTQLRALDRCIRTFEQLERVALDKAGREAELRLRLTAAGGALLLIMLW